MMDFKIEYLPTRYASPKPCAHDDVAYVRLAEVEKLITELEWAVERLSHMIYDRAMWHADKDPSYRRAQACLASVAAWRARQEGKQVAPVKVSKRTCNRHDDCDEADQKCGQGGATHCRVDDCEDCFGK